jgi:hypothetical protein
VLGIAVAGFISSLGMRQLTILSRWDLQARRQPLLDRDGDILPTPVLVNVRVQFENVIESEA